MRAPLRAWRGAPPLLLCVVALGCSTPAGRYLSRRGADLGDCAHAAVGLGWPVAGLLLPEAAGDDMGDGSAPGLRYLLRPQLYARVKATDFLVIGDGFAQPVRYGWRGRYRKAGTDWSLASGCPLLCPTHEETAGTTVHTRLYVLTERSYDGPEPGPGGQIAERLWIGVSATLLASVEFDLNLAELADLLVGWFGWDMLRDDQWTRHRATAR